MSTETAIAIAHQIDATTELARLLQLAAVKHLPPLMWTIAHNGTVTGVPDLLPGISDEARVAAIEEWAAALHLDIHHGPTHVAIGKTFGRHSAGLQIRTELTGSSS